MFRIESLRRLYSGEWNVYLLVCRHVISNQKLIIIISFIFMVCSIQFTDLYSSLFLFIFFFCDFPLFIWIFLSSLTVRRRSIIVVRCVKRYCFSFEWLVWEKEKKREFRSIKCIISFRHCRWSQVINFEPKIDRHRRRRRQEPKTFVLSLMVVFVAVYGNLLCRYTEFICPITWSIVRGWQIMCERFALRVRETEKKGGLIQQVP